MATPMIEWIETEGEKYAKMAHTYFFRDPCRPMFLDRDYFFSPADGFIITQGRYLPHENIDVKGVKMSVADLMGRPDFDEPALVIQVFMSCLDVHINRMPTDGTLGHYYLHPIRTNNVPMLWTEKGILEKHKILKGTMTYARDNGRVINEVICSWLRYKYYMVQIADSDVSCILHFSPLHQAPLNQCQRFGQIRWGSQVALIMPLDPRYKFRPTQKVEMHVEAGLDPLVAIERRE